MKTGSKAKNGKKAGMSKRERRFFWIGLLFLSPWLIGFLAFSVYPICAAVYYSFTDYSIFTAPKWVGVKNYLDIFADKMIWKSLLNTAYITVVGLPVSIIISLVLALLLNQKVKGLPIFRTIFYLPTVVPVVASAMLFMWVLNPEYGILNMALGAFGIRGPAWLSDPRFTKLSLILMDVWRCGGTMIIFLSALQSVPPTFYEAADLDGASAWKKFWKITVPYISPHDPVYHHHGSYQLVPVFYAGVCVRQRVAVQRADAGRAEKLPDVLLAVPVPAGLYLLKDGLCQRHGACAVCGGYGGIVCRAARHGKARKLRC